MSVITKKLGIFSMTSCEGCQFELLSFFEHFDKLLNFYQIESFRLGQENNSFGQLDVALIEGSPDDKEQIKLLREIRKKSKVCIAMGACAHMGGIQSQRNNFPKKYTMKERVISISDIIKVDYIVPGCPVSHSELLQCLLDVYWGKKFNLPDVPVCFECRQNLNKCLLKNDKPCLGPITRSGCNSVCINNGEACMGCRGPVPQANIEKQKEILKPLMDEEEIKNWLTIYGDIEKEYGKFSSKN